MRTPRYVGWCPSLVRRRFLLSLPAAEAESEDDAVGDAGASTEDDEVGSGSEPEDESSMAMAPLGSSALLLVLVELVGSRELAAACCREESDCAVRGGAEEESGVVW
jgi:hypothetical protein